MVEAIFVALDLTERSRPALSRGARLAAEHGAALHICHVVDEDLPDSVAQGLREEAERHIRTVLTDLGLADGESLAERCHIFAGRPVRHLLGRASEVGADLIVVGRSRARPLADIFTGTTVERIIRRATHPVLLAVLPGDRTYDRVVMGTDFSANARRAATLAADLAPSAEHHLVHAYDLSDMGNPDPGQEPSAERYERQMKPEMRLFAEPLRDYGVRPHRHFRRGMPREELRTAVAELDARLLAVGTHSRTGVRRALLGSEAESFFKNPPCDVLAATGW